MLLDPDKLLAEANAIYRKAKDAKGHEPHDIRSDQVKAVLTVICKAINRELLSPIVVTVDDVD